MKKTCDKHGTFTDVIAINPNWLERIERLYPGRDFKAPPTKLREHGSSSIQYGRGSVLTVDLTNRCNMMCDPCFMDANQVGYVHELSWDDIKKLLDDSLTIEPRRQMSVQFSGGEPTLSPLLPRRHPLRARARLLLRAVRHQRAALRRGARLRQQAKEAGLRMAYLQFDGIGNEANAHRKVGNLFDVKLRAIEELAAAGIDVILVVTVVNGVNNDQIGKILQFAVDNPDKITVVSFQPVSFTGRDEDIDDETREQQRYTLSHLAYDVQARRPASPSRCATGSRSRRWARSPIWSISCIGERADWGSMKCGCHPNCGIGTVLMVNKKTQQMVPLSQFLDVEGLLDDIGVITDAAQWRGGHRRRAERGAAQALSPRTHAPRGYGFAALMKQFLSQTGARGSRIGEYDSDAARVRVARPVRRRHVVPGSVQLRLPPHRDVHHPVRHADGRDLASAPTTPASAGATSSRRCCRTPPSPSGIETHGRHPVYAKGQELPDAGVRASPITSRLAGRAACAARVDVSSRSGERGDDDVGAIGEASAAAAESTSSPASSVALAQAEEARAPARRREAQILSRRNSRARFSA